MKPFRQRFLALWLLLALAAGMARAETVVWSDNFEGNAAGRWTNSGVWHISSPTAGPALNAGGHRAFSGTNCASTQTYPLNKDAWLVCTNYFIGTNSIGTNWLVVPGTNQSPRLRFWQWFNFDNALGYVELRTGPSNAWQQVSPTYVNINGGGVWSRPSLDLTAYAGQSVQIAFHFISGTGKGNHLGWFVDDVALVTGAPVLNLPEGFEAGEGDWAVDFGTWAIGRPAAGPRAAHTGTNCAGTVLTGNYTNNVSSRLISPPFLVPASGNVALSFWQWYSFKFALGYVEINNGSASTLSTTNTVITTTTNFAGLDTNVYQLFGAALADYDTPLYWNPTVGGWTNDTVALASVFDTTPGIGGFIFEAGTAPLIAGEEDYISYTNTSIPSPQTASPTNYLALQGVTWSSPGDANGTAVGYFGTNYTYTATTNVTIISTTNNWQTASNTIVISPGKTIVASPGWANAVVDLRAYAGQTVQVGFHFIAGDLYNAAGWYVDDLSFVAYPVLVLPPTQTINAGQTLTVTNVATNSLDPAATFTFALVPPATNAVITTNGVLTLTNTAVITTNGVLTLTNTAGLAGTYVYNIKATDRSPPALATTNSFTVVVLPPSPPSLAITNSPGTGRPVFQLSFQTPWTNTTWRLEATTNLAKANWLPVFTNLIGGGGTLSFTDLLATNYPRRFYRAIFP